MVHNFNKLTLNFTGRVFKNINDKISTRHGGSNEGCHQGNAKNEQKYEASTNTENHARLANMKIANFSVFQGYFSIL